MTNVQGAILAGLAFASGVGVGLWLARRFLYTSVTLASLTHDWVSHEVRGEVTSSPEMPHEIAARVYDGDVSPPNEPPDDTVHMRWSQVQTSSTQFRIDPTLDSAITQDRVTVAVWAGVYTLPTTDVFVSPGWGGPFAEGTVAISRPEIAGFRPPAMPGFSGGAGPKEAGGPGASGRRP